MVLSYAESPREAGNSEGPDNQMATVNTRVVASGLDSMLMAPVLLHAALIAFRKCAALILSCVATMTTPA